MTLIDSTSRTTAVARRLLGIVLYALAALVIAIWVIGRMDLGFVSTIANPWAVQCSVALVALALVSAMTHRRSLTLATLACAAWSSLVALPTLAPRPARDVNAGAAVLRVLEANVCNRIKPTAEAIASLRCERSDLVAILELTHAWERAFEELKLDLPYTVIGPQNELGSGVALYSRYPVRSGRVIVACEGADRQIEAIIEHPSGPIRVFVIHPLSPRSPERAALRDRELGLIAERCESSDMPTLVIGDFNETPYGKTFASFMERTGYVAARDVAGFAPTWPAEVDGWLMPAALRIPIDHIVMSKQFVARNFRVGTHIGSDHMPIVADLSFMPPTEPALIASPLPSARPEDQ